MEWIIVGVIVLIVFLLFLGLYFRASGAVTIAAEEQEEIEKESPEELEKEVEREEENAESSKAADDEFHSARG
ncbi:hypothetical protein A2419_02955 [Candidatus Adlerbacteria bacterium RIFOXYC1_FULL_48_26]|uniref:Uncharacterized protein n=1 Tax=Candidatus Adlerbacteria bacterium RIFOXYC1_FULL_48_26 TaxID=1797247 RepID=A0A1F4Y3R8_9BACT|nr:MAG: hypothetical protein A2419_02955 [Candidatus Adlerbacteria bacterium RIFOXYC1_FULL_48_26]OGC93569.1 MAG: hypothetical protein A2389_00795 [Candidatus Adlerbacteria bacterium RIFOXYB1_FULL_48_10]OGC95614.1 MAG: hypothetical protein A2590_00850 [Candidatus Adlerbacteria bacterium RIFOXYD1_FULL_48_8]